MPIEYLMDTCIVIELLHGDSRLKKWLEDNKDAQLNTSGWTIIELLKHKKSQTEMKITLKSLTQHKVLWTEPRIAEDIPTLLTEHFHTQRSSDGALSGNAIFDALIYTSAKSYNQKLLTRDKDFDTLKDIEIVNLDKANGGAYK